MLLLKPYTPSFISSPFLPGSCEPSLLSCTSPTPNSRFHIASLMSAFVIVSIRMQCNLKMAATTSTKYLGHIRSHNPDRLAIDRETKRNQQGGMYYPPILEITHYKCTWILSVQHWKLQCLERWKTHNSRDLTMASRRQGTNSKFLQLQQELDDICFLAITLQRKLSTLTSQVLSVLEFNFYQRNSF